MKYPNKIKRNNTIGTAATLLTVVTFVFAATIVVPSAYGKVSMQDIHITDIKAPVVVSGDNIYIAWWTNNTENGNEEVMFRASTDAGATFTDKINLSNTTDADSWRVEIAGEGEAVVVSWWETATTAANQTSDTPVARISTDGGETFGPMLRLATNGTLTSAEEGEEGETVEEEAVGGAEVAE
jgi:hypothetical protein